MMRASLSSTVVCLGLLGSFPVAAAEPSAEADAAPTPNEAPSPPSDPDPARPEKASEPGPPRADASEEGAARDTRPEPPYTAVPVAEAPPGEAPAPPTNSERSAGAAPLESVPASPAADEPPPPSGPVRQMLSLGLNLDVLWSTGRSFDLFSDDDVAQRFGVSAGYELWLSDEVTVVPGLGFAAEREESDGLFGGAVAETELASDVLYADVSLRYKLLSFLEPHARLAGGVSFVKMHIDTDRGTRFEDDAAPPFGSLGAGFTLKTRDRAFQSKRGALGSLSLGATVEGGYLVSAPADLSLDAEDDGRIDVVSSSLGDLERSGPYVRVALTGRF